LWFETSGNGVVGSACTTGAGCAVSGGSSNEISCEKAAGQQSKTAKLPREITDNALFIPMTLVWGHHRPPVLELSRSAIHENGPSVLTKA
jgi:hypothetical protein